MATVNINMTSHDIFFLREALDTNHYVWVNLKTQKVVLCDTGDKVFSERVHHTDYVKAHPAEFGLTVEEVIDADRTRDEKLLIKVLNNEFVRAVIYTSGEGNEMGIEGIDLRGIYKALKIILRNYQITVNALYIDLRSPKDSNALPKSFGLSQRKLEYFLKTGAISNSRMLEAYQEEEDGSFTHDGDDYDLNALLRATEDLDVVKVSIDKLEWILDHDKPDFHRLVSADIDAPILITKWKGKLTVIDGLHRLAAALIQGEERIKAKLVDRDLLAKFRIT